MESANTPPGFNRSEIAFGLVNGCAVSIHHDARKALFLATAFIFDEGRECMVNRGFSSAPATVNCGVPCEPRVKKHPLERELEYGLGEV
jgi:hypothetical protein